MTKRQIERMSEKLADLEDYLFDVRCELEAAGYKARREPRWHCDAIEDLAERNRKLAVALAFAQSCILGGEPWTPTCDRIIGVALKAERAKQSRKAPAERQSAAPKGDDRA